MNKRTTYWFGCSICALSLASGGMAAGTKYSLENNFISRSFVVEAGRLRTTGLVNKLAKKTLTPTACAEFRLRISKGTHTTGTDVALTAADFKVIDVKEYAPSKAREGLAFTLKNADRKLTVVVRYELHMNEFYMHKSLEITSGVPVTLERIDVDAISMADAEQPYKLKVIHARGKWSPGLGQPLYTNKTGTFWGIEFPAAYNFVDGQKMNCGYLWGREVKAGATYKTYKSVVGVSDDAAFVQDAFFDYIDRIRIRPLRLQIQYNSWFDFGRGVNKERFKESIDKIYQELVVERGNKPLVNYVIDDGWQDTRADWSTKVWPVNGKFDKDFAFSRKAVAHAKSELGLWLSPGCLFGAQGAVPSMRRKGLEALGSWMSLAGPKYTKLLEERMVELTKQGASYFKLDGCFGHLNTREFELHGEKYGIPYMPQLDVDGMAPNDKRLNSSKYDELKTYYLVAGTERLMDIFLKMDKANPDVYIVISNGAYLSPWWLMYCDSIWMIMAGDAAGGADRTGELVYRDGVYYEIWETENTQFPMCAIFNHEPKKKKTGEPKDVFRKYLYMNISRGTGFIELYLKTQKLQEADWDVLAEGLHWSYHVFPTFKHVRMHGGNPRKKETYGYTAWTKDRGYVSIHNPSNEDRTYNFTLDRAFGLAPNSGTFHLSSPMEDCLAGLAKTYSYGDKIELKLKAREIRILNFDKTTPDWSVLRELQGRHKMVEASKPKPPKPLNLKGHALLGKWEYMTNYTREFTLKGECILRQGKKVIWKKKCIKANKKSITVQGNLKHVLQKDGTLKIENKYTAKRAE